jgi:pantoate--beta-alanine ligase
MIMQIVTEPSMMQTLADRIRMEGKRIGFVPTMGYLHEGHLALVRASKAQCDVTVVSIFVNPTQFGPSEDLERYPRDFDRDHGLLEKEGVEILFTPAENHLYPKDFATEIRVGKVTDRLCGASRPWHFPGVALIVCKLFHMVRPHAAFFGQKDYQQCLVIQRMVRDLDFGIDIHVVPTVREEDGLAMSSRNQYLSPQDRIRAVSLVKALSAANRLYLSGERSPERLSIVLEESFQSIPQARIDYAEVLDAETLAPVTPETTNMVAALAVFFGNTRLIDNHILGRDLPIR